MNIHQAVKQFHQAAEVPIRELPEVPSTPRLQLRLRLVAEEFTELLAAAGVPIDEARLLQNLLAYIDCTNSKEADLVSIADALCDLDYVIEGFRLEAGINGEAVLEEVHRSNLAKVKGGKRLSPAGKVLKPEGWKSPEIAAVLANQWPLSEKRVQKAGQ